jgi:hypothetical protein
MILIGRTPCLRALLIQRTPFRVIFTNADVPVGFDLLHLLCIGGLPSLVAFSVPRRTAFVTINAKPAPLRLQEEPAARAIACDRPHAQTPRGLAMRVLIFVCGFAVAFIVVACAAALKAAGNGALR